MVAGRRDGHDNSCCEALTRLRCSVSEFEALCANDGELGELRASIRDFVTADRAAYGWEPAVDSWLAKWDPAFSARLAEAGFVGLTIPAEYGGHGLGHLHRYVVTEELLAQGAPVAAHWIADRQVAPGLLAYGSEEQRRRLLPRIAAGTLYSAIGMSEHGAGSDLAAVTTRAVATEGGWLLNGTKVWTSGAHLAHRSWCWRGPAHSTRSIATPASVSSSCRPTPRASRSALSS